MAAFEELGMMEPLIQAMEDMEWFLPKPVQQEAVPLILGGGDVMCAAETGSGKTGAFCLPIIQSTWETLQEKINPDRKRQALARARMSREDTTATLRTTEDGLQCMTRDQHEWAGARGNYGVTQGKYYYEVKVLADNVCRLGWSTIEADLVLGTDGNGFGYGGTAKKSFRSQFEDYGEKYGRGDYVGCLLNRDDGEVSFTRNGKSMGVAFSPIPSSMKDQAIYPALAMRNCHCQVNFGDSKFTHPPPKGYTPIAELGKDLAHQERLYEEYWRLKEREAGGGHHATALIIEPTLELAQQVVDELDKFLKYVEGPRLNHCTIIGKREFGTIMRELDGGVDIIVGTPGRLESMVKQNKINMTSMRFFVLDEADRLSTDNLDVLLRIYEDILKVQKNRVQVCMFSATLHSPEITKLYKQICPKASWVDLKGKDYVPDTVHHGVVYIDPEDRRFPQAPTADYHDDEVHLRDGHGDKMIANSLGVKRTKPEIVQKIIEAYKMEQVLIFCRTRIDCDNLKNFLDKRGGGRKFSGKVEKGKENPFASVALHSGYTAYERQENLEMFKDGDVRILICTDVAARGIDIKELPYVINVTLPDKEEDYIHRVGRVGRADHMGLAVSVVARRKEKVWYHTCPKRGEGCTNTRLVSEKGCCIWYDEPDLIQKIEARIGEPLTVMDENFRHPSHAGTGDEKVVYGKTKQDANRKVSQRVLGLIGESEELNQMEWEVQDGFLSMDSLVSEALGLGKKKPSGRGEGQAPPSSASAATSSSGSVAPPSAPKAVSGYRGRGGGARGRGRGR